MTDYHLRHVTRFEYAFPVRFARCNLRLHPIEWDGQTVSDHAFTIRPAAAIRRGRDGGYRAILDRLVVEKPATALVIESVSRLTIHRPAPAPAANDINVADAARLAREARDLSAMAPANYLYPSPLIAAFADIAAWCAQELRPDRGVVEAGLALAQAIQRDFDYDGSATELDTSPAEAFAARHGVCQDFAQIMISGARAAGIAAAYVSGYLRTIPPGGRSAAGRRRRDPRLVMLWCGPARGWIGFDPTNGVTVGSDHIVCAIGPRLCRRLPHRRHLPRPRRPGDQSRGRCGAGGVIGSLQNRA